MTYNVFSGTLNLTQLLNCVYMYCNFICGLSDVIIKTFSQSVTIVSGNRYQGPEGLAAFQFSCILYSLCDEG